MTARAVAVALVTVALNFGCAANDSADLPGGSDGLASERSGGAGQSREVTDADGATVRPDSRKLTPSGSSGDSGTPRVRSNRTAKPDSYMANIALVESTFEEARRWWPYGELLRWKSPERHSEFVVVSDVAARSQNDRNRVEIEVWYLPAGADPFEDSVFSLTDDGAIAVRRWFVPAGQKLDHATTGPISGRTYSRSVHVRGQDARMREERTDCESDRCPEAYQIASNRHYRWISANIPRDGGGTVQWEVAMSPAKMPVAEHIAFIDALIAVPG